MRFKLPWSKRHKKVTGGLPYSFSNSYAEPLTSAELIELSKANGDQAIVDEYFNHSLEYTANGGSADLREAIAALYGPAIGPENILVFSGAQAAISTMAFALLDEETHSIVFTPGYQSVQEAPYFAGSQVTKISLRYDNDWRIDLDEVAAAIQPNTKYIVVNQPANPTGTLMTAEEQSRLVQLAQDNDIYVLSDEVYRLIEHTEDVQIPAMADIYHRGTSIVTLSKPWGACGVTIGWIATQDMQLLDTLSDIQYFGTACPSRASELLAIMTLRNSDAILQKNIAIIKTNMALLDQFFDDYHAYFEWVRPNAGAVGFVRFKGPWDTDRLGLELAKAGISIKPAYVFSEQVTEVVDFFRLGYGERKMAAALEQLKLFIELHKAEWQQQMR
ncbi:MAG: aminotransferase class I/II-fold pyridoxal phosphate-dependent enzyme [Gammaproteobacteria bacterium]